jgi:hypothetical protein
LGREDDQDGMEECSMRAARLRKKKAEIQMRLKSLVKSNRKHPLPKVSQSSTAQRAGESQDAERERSALIRYGRSIAKTVKCEESVEQVGVPSDELLTGYNIRKGDLGVLPKLLGNVNKKKFKDKPEYETITGLHANHFLEMELYEQGALDSRSKFVRPGATGHGSCWQKNYATKTRAKWRGHLHPDPPVDDRGVALDNVLVPLG